MIIVANFNILSNRTSRQKISKKIGELTNIIHYLDLIINQKQKNTHFFQMNMDYSPRSVDSI